jgi:hypothetical protein
MADDYTGWRTGWAAFDAALLTDQGINYPNEQIAQAFRQFVALLKQKMALQGITI